MAVMAPTVNANQTDTTISKSNSYLFRYNYVNEWTGDRYDEAVYTLTLLHNSVEVATATIYNYTGGEGVYPGSLQQNYTYNASAYADYSYDTIELHCHFVTATDNEINEYYYWGVDHTACKAPTTVSVSSTNVAPNASVTLSWSGEIPGNDVIITALEIWRSTSATGTYSKIATTSGYVSSTTVTSPAANGSYYYKIKVLGNPAAYASPLSTAYATLTTKVTANTAPTSVSVASTNVAPNTNVNLSWSGATHGTNTTISGYAIYRSTSANGTYTLLKTVSSSPTSVASPSANGSYYFKVVAVSSVVGFDSGKSSVYATLTTNFTAPSKPSVSLSATYVKSGNVTLSWSSSNGTNNAIKKYIVYRNGTQLQEITSTAATGSLSVACNPTAGGSYAFTVVAVGNYSNSATSDGVTLYTYSDPVAPQVLQLSNTQPALSASVTLLWQNANAGALNAITGYKVYRATAADGTYTQLGSDISTTATSGSVTVTSPANASTKYYYKVVTKGTRSNSGYSAYIALGSNSTPNAPTLNPCGTTYNSRPRLLVTVGTDADGDLQALQATGWAFTRSSGLSGGSKVLARKSTAVSSASTFNVSVVQSDPVGASATKTESITFAVKSWTDDPVLSGVTVIKAAHITELQGVLDDICDYYDLGRTEWLECVAGQTSTLMWNQHITQINYTIQRIAQAVNEWDSTTSALGITLPNLPTSLTPEATIIEQLRAAITLL